MVYEFNCNGEVIWAEVDRRGGLHLHENSVGEQCEGCGADIFEAGTARLFNAQDLRVAIGGVWGVVTCSNCEARYELAPASEAK